MLNMFINVWFHEFKLGDTTHRGTNVSVNIVIMNLLLNFEMKVRLHLMAKLQAIVSELFLHDKLCLLK